MRLGQVVPPRGRVADSPSAPCLVPVAVHMGSGDVCSSVEFGVRLVCFGWGSVMFFGYGRSTEVRAEQFLRG